MAPNVGINSPVTPLKSVSRRMLMGFTVVAAGFVSSISSADELLGQPAGYIPRMNYLEAKPAEDPTQSSTIAMNPGVDPVSEMPLAQPAMDDGPLFDDFKGAEQDLDSFLKAYERGDNIQQVSASSEDAGFYTLSNFETNTSDFINFQTEVPPAAPPAINSNDSSSSDAATGGSTGGESLGIEPEDRSLDFLRTVSPLLAKGECQFDMGFVYSMYENDIPILFDNTPDPDGIAEGRVLVRTMTVPFALRYGLTDRVQLFVNAPVGWSRGEVSFPGWDIFDDVGGIGDINFGASILLSEPSSDTNKKDVVSSFYITAPSGNSSFSTVIQNPNAQLGQGHWDAGASLLCIRSIDPVVIFYGGGIRYQFDNRDGATGINVQPGLDISYQFGLGFAVNDKVTLSSILLGSYITEAEFNGDTLPYSSLEPVRLRFAATIARPCNRIFEPFVEIGATQDANAFTLGWTCTYGSN